jgi:hypothetical protein
MNMQMNTATYKIFLKSSVRILHLNKLEMKLQIKVQSLMANSHHSSS